MTKVLEEEEPDHDGSCISGWGFSSGPLFRSTERGPRLVNLRCAYCGSSLQRLAEGETKPMRCENCGGPIG